MRRYSHAASSHASQPRLIRRQTFAGITTNVEYEASGCGCGGFSALVENVKHVGGYGQLLYQEERRYDVTANVTASRWNHLGGYGEAHRYDGAHRLVYTYEGVPMQGGQLDYYADPANTPTTFTLRRDYGLDTKSNRTGLTLKDDGLNTIKSIGYTADADTNVYLSIDGQTYNYDANDNQTFDPTTGMYKRYDYMGRLVAEDNNSDFATPERRYRYDVHSRMRVAETNYNTTFENAFTDMYCCFPNEDCGGCDGNDGLTYMEEERVSSADASMLTVEYTPVVGLTDSMSGSAQDPNMVTGIPTGPNNRKSFAGIALKSWPVGESTQIEWVFALENQQRSVLGTVNLDGFRRDEFDYNEYGQVFRKKVLWDGSAGQYIDDVVEGEVEELQVAVVTANTTNSQPVTDDMLGALARVAVPDDGVNDGFAVFGRVVAVNTGAGEFSIEDPNGDVLAALGEDAAVLTVFEHHDADIDGGQVHLAGRWDEAPTEDGGVTTFTGSGVFPEQAVGWFLQPNAAVPMFFPILAVTTTTIDVAGDLTGLDLGEGWYFILPPVGVDRDTGATDTAPCAIPTRYLAFGYYYVTPTAGVYIAEHETLATGIHGRQPADNLAGEYYAWHRRYDPVQGRWTTPDPAMTPWWNPVSYVDNAPTSHSDPLGLREHPISETSRVVHEARTVEGLNEMPRNGNAVHGPWGLATPFYDNNWWEKLGGAWVNYDHTETKTASERIAETFWVTPTPRVWSSRVKAESGCDVKGYWTCWTGESESTWVDDTSYRIRTWSVKSYYYRTGEKYATETLYVSAAGKVLTVLSWASKGLKGLGPIGTVLSLVGFIVDQLDNSYELVGIRTSYKDSEVKYEHSVIRFRYRTRVCRRYVGPDCRKCEGVERKPQPAEYDEPISTSGGVVKDWPSEHAPQQGK